MIQDKVIDMMNAAKERIIKTMQERGITKINLVMTWEEYAKENDLDPADIPADEYNDYCNQEAPYVIYFNKWGNGTDYAAYSVRLVDGALGPRFKLECYNSDEGTDYFYDYDLTYLSMIGVYDVMERELELEDAPQTVWVFTAEQASECDVADTIVETFPTEKAAREYMRSFLHDGGEDSVVNYVERNGWKVERDEPNLYRAFDEDHYCSDHIECAITECEIIKDLKD